MIEIDEFNLNNLLESEELVWNAYNRIKESIHLDFESRHNIISVSYNDIKHELKASRVLVNCIFWANYAKFGKEKFRDEYVNFINSPDISADTISNIQDIIIKDFIKSVDKIELRKTLSHNISVLATISNEYNPLIGNTINVFGFVELARRNKEFNRIIHKKNEYKQHMITKDIEEDLDKELKNLLKILGEDEGNPFYDYIRCSEGINANQLVQFMISIGLKPDVFGNVIPYNVKNNFFVDGLSTPGEFFVDAAGGRKAQIFSNDDVKDSGYNDRKMALSCTKTVLHKGDDYCDSPNKVELYIDNMNTIKRLVGRYIDDDGEDVLLTDSNIENYLDETIYLYSPITCCHPSGAVCKRCYGSLSDVNSDIHIGLIGSKELNSQLTQNLLSAKHLLKTLSEKIDWPKGFEEVFVQDFNTVILNPTIESTKDIELVFNVEDIEELEDINVESNEFESSETFTLNMKTSKFLVRSKKNTFSIDGDKELFMSLSLTNKISKIKEKEEDIEEIVIKLEELKLDEPIFYVIVVNSELSKQLKQITGLIDRKSTEVMTFSEKLQRFDSMLSGSKINIQLVHIENIIRELIRQPQDHTLRPDFSEDNPDYEILTVTAANIKDPALSVSLAFENIKRQLIDPSTYYKTSISPIDQMY